MLEMLPLLSVLLTAMPTSQTLSIVLGSSGVLRAQLCTVGGPESH